MINQILELLISTLVEIYTMIILLRLMMQIARADFYNPISQFVVKATDPLLKPLRRFVPGFWGIDFPSLLLALLVQILGFALLMLLKGSIVANPLAYLIFGLFGVCNVALQLAFFAILIVIVVSWVAPQSYNPAVMLLRQVTEPIMAPFRKILPPMGGLDFSPMLAMFVIHVLRTIVLPHMVMALGV